MVKSHRSMKSKTAKSSPSALQSVMDVSAVESSSQIDFSAVMPPSQRYDSPISIKDGIQKKKVRPNYKVATAPVYDPVQERAAADASVRDDSKLDDDVSMGSMISKRSAIEADTGDGGDDADANAMSRTAANFIIITAVLALVIGLGCFGGCIGMIVSG